MKEQTLCSDVCSRCFEDQDIAKFIIDCAGPIGCSFCDLDDAPTAPLECVGNHIRRCLEQSFSLAVDQVPWDSSEGGYVAQHWETHELLFDDPGLLSLPRDQSQHLSEALTIAVGEAIWCRYDWQLEDYNDALVHSWDDFCQVIRHERRFFFSIGRGDSDRDRGIQPDKFTPLGLLTEIKRLAERLDLIKEQPIGTEFFRARKCNSPSENYTTAKELGPPPPASALVSNRMNPPGIPMLYASESNTVAVDEVASEFCQVSVGRFCIEREMRILDLVDIPPVPGLFSGVERMTRLGLDFVRHFADEISKPTNSSKDLDYVPSQVVTEFIRDAYIGGGQVHGIRYRSSKDSEHCNLVIFATQDDLMEKDGSSVTSKAVPNQKKPWIRLLDADVLCGSKGEPS